jgi:outer membrane protein OmpA-like peptidoglycan-associated protein/ABC-type nitrate/sulfonate/bicarbonate transport system substrate-binding protein
VLELPFIFWGGDVATFHANGGLETTSESLFGKQGIKLKLTPGDNFDNQVKAYLDNKTPFLRGTLSMLGQASADLTKKPETTPVVFLQLTWSAGDHLVGRASFRDLGNLKGKKIAIQKGGPHVGMLNDMLNTVKLTWRDISVVWTDEVSGDKGPAALFRKDQSIDACFAISPEMFELTSAPDTGGVTSTGDGTKKSVKGTHVVVSTQHMSRSIADVYAVRKDFFDANKDYCEKFAAAYIKACEELVKTKSDDESKADPAYKKIIKLARDIWGKDPAFKDSVKDFNDVNGLISDAVFVGLPGNESFFQAKGNLSGFQFKMAQAVALPDDPSKEPLRVNATPLLNGDLNFAAVRRVGDLQGKAPTQPRIRAEAALPPAEEKIYEFLIFFEPDQPTFPEAKYGSDFQRALEQASLFGNAVVAIRGHADPSGAVADFIDSAKAQGIMTGPDDWHLTLKGKKFDPKKDTKTMLETLKQYPNLQVSVKNGLRTETRRVQMVVDYLQELSDKRANSVRNSVLDYARSHNLILDNSQLRHVGLGMTEPVDGFATTEAASAKNRRVQFMILKVPDKDVSASEFDL